VTTRRISIFKLVYLMRGGATGKDEGNGEKRCSGLMFPKGQDIEWGSLKTADEVCPEYYSRTLAPRRGRPSYSALLWSTVGNGYTSRGRSSGLTWRIAGTVKSKDIEKETGRPSAELFLR